MSSFFAVGGNPFSTPVGHKIEQATDRSLASENWALNMEICDLINETEDGPKDAIKALRKRLQQAGKNYTIVLETCVKNCGKRFHVLVCSKEFVGELVKLIGPKNEPPPVVQEKVLNLIQCWADAFRNHQDLNGVVQIYQELRAKGIEFPMTDLDSMAPIHTPKKSVKSEPSVVDSGHMNSPQGHMSSPQVVMAEATGPLPADQISKLKSEIDVLQTNMTVFNEMLNEMSPGNEHPSDIELFQELYTTLVAMQTRLVELISKLSNDEITADLLRINDDLNNLFLRHSRYEKNRGVANTENGQELIDLNSEASGSVPAITKQVEAMGVGSQLAGLSTVTARSGQQKDVDDTDFDVFAQSRKVTYNSSTMGGSTYESNSKPDQVSGSLAAVSEARAQGQSMHKESDFDEMAAWLEQEGGQRGIEESLTSSEFERFLAERAAAAENLPTGRNESSTPRKGKDPQENSLYAL